MSRRRVNEREIRIHRTISVSPSFWVRYKAWCRGKSMSELLEMAALRMMDEKNDVLSLTQQAEELRGKISTKKYDLKKTAIEIENEEHNLNVIEDRIAEMKSSDKALALQQETDYEWMRFFRDDNLSKIKRGWPKWINEELGCAAYLPSISIVQERTAILDKMNPKETRMGWIALKFPEDEWEMVLKRESSLI